MKERPILFNGEMVRAILDGRKTQTRRPMNPQPEFCGGAGEESDISKWGFHSMDRTPHFVSVTEFAPPLGTVGDRLWVRETFRIYRSFIECACYDDCQCASMNGKPLYRASYPSPDDDKWTPSIHMPRWASRIDLEITRVWVERVQDITEEDALKEGCEGDPVYGHNGFPNGLGPRDEFRDLWQSIYGTWDANPFVWAYEFRRIKP